MPRNPENPNFKALMPFRPFDLLKLKKTFKLMKSLNININEDLYTEVVEAHKEIKQSGEVIIYIPMNKYDTIDLLQVCLFNHPEHNINHNKLKTRFQNIIEDGCIWL